MSFQPPSAKQEQQNKKVLEELHLKKKLMLKQATGVINSPPANSPVPAASVSVPVASSSSSTSVPIQPTTTAATDYHGLNKSQRAALQHAHANSSASFIPQDSSFGNLILPVMPRLDK